MSIKAVHRKPSLLQCPRAVGGATILVFLIVVAAFAPLIAPYQTDTMDLSLRLCSPNIDYWFGCDLNGGDVFTAMLYGARTSLLVAFAVVFLSLTIGLVVGLSSGYFGGWIETIQMRFVDILMAFPGILLAMALASLLGPSTANLILAISATGWTSTARIVRAQVLSLKTREYIVANKALGASHLRTIIFHILPGTWSPLLVHSTFSLSGVILIEASLSFLGLGAQEGGSLSWGGLLNQGRTVLVEAPHLSIAPGLAIMTIVLSLNFLGDSLRDYLDPRHN